MFPKRRERYCEKGRNLTYREKDQEIGTVEACDRRDPEEVKRMRLKIL